MSSSFRINMKAYKIFLIIIIFGISYIWLGNVYSHQKEKHIDKSVETHTESHTIEQNTLPVPMSVPALQEEHKHPQKVEIGSYNIIQFGKKQGYNVAVIFIISIAVIWGIVSFYWRDDKRKG